MLSTASPFSFLLFGASGHLAKIKIYPALYTLALKKRLPDNYAIVGYARSEMTEEAFRSFIEESVRTHMPEVNDAVLNDLLGRCVYQQGQYDNVEDFRKLAERLTVMEKPWGETVRLAYFSIPPNVFSDVLQNLCKGGVHDHARKGSFRCIVEKPVGHDLASANVILDELSACFGEEETYLLDHYMGKEAVKNIFYLRYANPVLERLLKNTLIHHVEITAMESAGLEGRAGYFENTGTFLDMFQSHLLMMASLLTMRLEENDAFRISRLNALEQFYLPPAASMQEIVLQAQYTAGNVAGTRAKGYTEEENVPAGTRTNTYVAMKLMSRTSRWAGVPFYLRSGKRLTKKETRISIAFQEPHPVGPGSSPNRLDIILQGEAGMRLHLQTKVGGMEPQFRPLIMEDPLVCVGDCLPEHGTLILEAIHGNQQWFLSFEEVRAAWRLVDPVEAYLNRNDTPLHFYAAGSMGPKEADAWIRKDGLEGWF